jgi:hypothetical protein
MAVEVALPALEAAVASLAAGAFLATGYAVRQRETRAPSEARAIELFSLWWCGLAAFAAGEATLDVARVMDAGGTTLALALLVGQVVAFTVGLWGLAYYVAFVLTGRSRLLAPLAVACALWYAGVLFAATLGRLPPASLTAALLVPPLVVAAGYNVLAFLARGAAQRRRVLAAATGVVGWLTSLLLARGSFAPWWPYVPLAVAGVSALLVFGAFTTERPEPAAA